MIPFFKRKCCIILGIIALMPCTSLWAQQHYSLSLLIETAKKYLPLLQQKQSLLNASRASLTDVQHSFLPQLRASEQLNIGSDNSLAGSFFTFGITPSTSAGVRTDNNTQAATGNVAVLYSEYELVNFGLNHAKLQTASAYADMQQADLVKDEYFVESSVAKLYFNILKEYYRLSADKQNMERYENIYRVIWSLTASGLKPGSDSSLTKAELSKTKIGYNQTLGKINQLKQQLSLYTGVPAKQLLIDTLGDQFFRHIPATVDYPMDSLSNPLINFYAKKKNIYQSNDQLIRKSYLPKIMLVGSVWARGSSIQFNDQYKSLGTGLGYQRFNYAIGVAFTYNLFNGIYKKDKLAVNRYQLEASDFELKQQQLVLTSAALQADNILETTQNNLLELPVQLRSAEAVYSQKLAQYKAGLITLIDLTNASFVLYRSQTDYIETVSDWYLAQLDKATATGHLQQFIQTIK